jgi:hypothetical protein
MWSFAFAPPVRPFGVLFRPQTTTAVIVTQLRLQRKSAFRKTLDYLILSQNTESESEDAPTGAPLRYIGCYFGVCAQHTIRAGVGET